MRALLSACILALASGLAHSANSVGQQGVQQSVQQQQGAQQGVEKGKQFFINGREAAQRDLDVITNLERTSGRPAVAGSYWYDNVTGAIGLWGGPTIGFLTPGLALGGPLPANASGGGDGRLTGVFINGREIHPLDVQGLQQMLGIPVSPGRWWIDAKGNSGMEGGPAIFNLFLLAKQNKRNTGGSTYYKNYGEGDSTFVSNGCAAVNGSLGSGDSKSSYSYYVGCE